MRRWTDEKYFDVDKVLAAFGNMPGEMIDYGAKALKPVENYIVNYLKLWDNLDNPQVVESWHAMNTWVTDNISARWRSVSATRSGLVSQRSPDEGRAHDSRPMRRPKPAASQFANCDRRGRSHHSALPVRVDPLQSWKYRQGSSSVFLEGTSASWPGAAHTSAHGRTLTPGSANGRADIIIKPDSLMGFLVQCEFPIRHTCCPVPKRKSTMAVARKHWVRT